MGRDTLRGALLATAAVLLCAQASALAAWQVPEEIVVTGRHYTLADVLPKEAQAGLAPEVLNQTMGLSPTLAHPRVFSGQLLASRLAVKTGTDLVARGLLTVPDQVVVRRESQTVSAEALLAALQAEDSPFAQHHPGFRAVARRPLPPVRLPGGELTLAIPSASHPAVSVLVNGREAARINLDIYYDIDVPTLVAARSLDRGEVLNATDADTAWQSYRKAAGNVRAVALTGQQTKRAIAPGTPLSAAMFQPVPLVNRGDVVKVLAQKGTLTISLTGEALSAGAQGEQVRVRNRDLKRVFTATVLEPGLVLVGPGQDGGR